MSSIEYRRDIIGEKLYASRNFNQLRHTYEAPGANRASVDWGLTLRQARKPLELKGSASAPSLLTAELAGTRERQPLAPAHPEGPYHSEKFQNVGNTAHLLREGNALTMDWHVNLRGGLHRSEFTDSTWRRHFARSQLSFDMMKENCTASNESFMSSQITPQDRRPDRQAGAICIGTIRDDPISFRRSPGSEGTQAGSRHLLEDRRFGQKDEANRAARMQKEPRKDANIPETHVSKSTRH